MATLLIKNARVLVTHDPQKRQIHGGGLYVRDRVIEQVGKTEELPTQADEIIDAKDLAIVPGMVNTHHHFWQSLTRAVPGCQNEGLFDWLVRLFPIWAELTDEAVRISTKTAMAEMILSGCTTSSDHMYLYPNDSTLDTQVKAAAEIGMRFQVTRGSQSLSREKGGLPPESCVEEEDAVLMDCQRVIETYHDPSPYSMVRVAIGPCSPFTVTLDLMRESAKLARAYQNVRLHTHVAETRDEEKFCDQMYGQRPARLMESIGWVGPDVWWAHSIFVNSDEIKMMAETGTSVAHCPGSNMRLGSGICPVREMVDAGVKVGLGVDGSASNDSGHFINEARLAMLLQRVKGGADAFSVQEALELASKGGAAVLGRDDIGSLEPGKAADFIGVNLNTLSMAGGAVHDPLAALLLCAVDRVDLSVINGKIVVRDGQLLTIDLPKLVARHNEIAAEMVGQQHSVPERFKLV